MHGLECMTQASLRGQDVDEACPGTVDQYRTIYKRSPDQGSYYAWLLIEWNRHLAQFTKGRMMAQRAAVVVR